MRTSSYCIWRTGSVDTSQHIMPTCRFTNLSDKSESNFQFFLVFLLVDIKPAPSSDSGGCSSRCTRMVSHFLYSKGFRGGIHQFSGETRLSRLFKITTRVALSGSCNSPIHGKKCDLSDFGLSRAFQ
jgi:hypothetical protein